MTSFDLFLLILGIVIGWAGHAHWHRIRMRRLLQNPYLHPYRIRQFLKIHTPKKNSTWIDPQ